MSDLTIVKFLFREDWGPLTEGLKLNPLYEVEQIEAANDLTTYLSGVPGSLVVASLRDKNDLIQIATFIKQAKTTASNACFKIMLINFSGDKQFEKAAAKLGILDLVDVKIPTKALRFKIDFMAKSINAQIKKKEATANVNAVKSAKEAKTLENKVSNHEPVWNEALDCEDDIWILKNSTDCKKILSRWLVKLMGPSPYVAQWVESGTSGIWKFEFKKEEVQNYIFSSGAWYFRGDQKPDFVWRENLWQFTGNSFDLFYKENEDIHSRLKLTEKKLIVAKNSEYAKTKVDKITESFDKDLVLKKELTGSEDEKISKDQENYKNLEGKGKTTQYHSKPLSMDLAPGENDTSHDPLTQKTDTAKESTHWNGKNTYEKNDKKAEFSAPKDKEVNSGAQLSLETNNVHKNHYRNHNEAEKFEAKDDLGGKSSTDKLNGHMSSSSKENEANSGAQLSLEGNNVHKNQYRNQNEAENPKAKGDLGGKSSTDKLSGHMSSGLGKTSATPELPAKETGKILPFAKEMTLASSDEVSKELTEAMCTAKVTASLVQDSLSLSCELDDYFDQLIIFRALKSELKPDQAVLLNLNFNYMNKDTQLKFNGDITEMVDDGEGSQYITVKISKENESAFNSFIKLYDKRQDNISLFLDTVKGY